MKKFFASANIAAIAVFAFCFSIPFGTKKFILPFVNNSTEEIRAAFVFLSDVWLLVFALILFVLLYRNSPPLAAQRFRLPKIALISGIIFIAFSSLSVFVSPMPELGAYSLIRLVFSALGAVLLCVLAVRTNKFIKSPLNTPPLAARLFIPAAVFLSGVFQAAVGILQFLRGESLGLRYLGESVINHGTEGVARVSVHGAYFLRAYGTMPHANILAAFLVFSLISGLFLLVICKHREAAGAGRYLRITFISAGIFIIIFGLAATFSRSGWIVGLFSAAAFFALSFAVLPRKQDIVIPFSVFAVSLAALFAVFGWAIFPRVSLSRAEPSVDLRVNYMKMDARIALSNPFLGAGIGNEVIYAENSGFYEKFGVLKRSDFQPTHNLFILSAAEIGFFGAAAFFVFLAAALFGGKLNIENAWLRVVFAGFLVFGLFDHFFWTLNSGRVMFWVVVFYSLLAFNSDAMADRVINKDVI